VVWRPGRLPAVLWSTACRGRRGSCPPAGTPPPRARALLGRAGVTALVAPGGDDLLLGGIDSVIVTVHGCRERIDAALTAL
jgi:hypothetical protein